MIISRIADVLSESVSHIVSKGDKTDLTMNVYMLDFILSSTRNTHNISL